MTPVAIWKWLCDEPHGRRGVRIAGAGIGLALLFRVFTELPFAAFLFGPNGITAGVQGGDTPAVENMVTGVFGSMTGTYALLAVLALSAFALVMGYETRVATLVAYVSFFLLGQRSPLLEDGGDNISRIVLGYLLFALPVGKDAPKGSARVFLHNLAVVAITVQVMILYETSGLYKAFGERWHHGTAMYYISQVEWFSQPAFRGFLQNAVVTTLASYGTILYQVAFPVAMMSRVKFAWLLMGFGLHLGILVTMGLVTFSTVMISLELFMITDEEWVMIGEKYRRFSAQVARLGERVRLRISAARRPAPEL